MARVSPRPQATKARDLEPLLRVCPGCGARLYASYRTAQTVFPYLLEPSPVGRTIYAMGYSTPPEALRTSKMERIEHAELTTTPFEIPADFDGPALLTRAWGIMYGDEVPVQRSVYSWLRPGSVPGDNRSNDVSTDRRWEG